MLDEKTLERIMDSIALGSAMPEGYNVCEVSEYLSDEHDIHRSVVAVDLAAQRFYKFSFRFNYFMKDSELLDHIPVVEVEPFEQVVISYKVKD